MIFDKTTLNGKFTFDYFFLTGSHDFESKEFLESIPILIVVRDN